jgi:hypothetical protein
MPKLHSSKEGCSSKDKAASNGENSKAPCEKPNLVDTCMGASALFHSHALRIRMAPNAVQNQSRLLLLEKHDFWAE